MNLFVRITVGLLIVTVLYSRFFLDAGSMELQTRYYEHFVFGLCFPAIILFIIKKGIEKYDDLTIENPCVWFIVFPCLLTFSFSLCHEIYESPFSYDQAYFDVFGMLAYVVSACLLKVCTLVNHREIVETE